VDSIETIYGTRTIAPAGPEDVDAQAAIGESTSAWLESRGIDAGRPPRPLHEIVADRVRQGNIYLASLDGAPAATVTLLCEPEDLWSDLPGNACYVHGLMVHRDFAGRQIGLALLRWAERETAAQGKSLLRLDCQAENPELRAYYERAGFTHRGDVCLGHRTAARFERRIIPSNP
jgi:GNAT superfamily N-acetyltransferase